jgi:hypothetical protein
MVAQHISVFATTASEPTQHVAIIDEMKPMCPHRLMCTSTHAQGATSLSFACIALHCTQAAVWVAVLFLFLGTEDAESSGPASNTDLGRCMHTYAPLCPPATRSDAEGDETMSVHRSRRKREKAAQTPGSAEDRSGFRAWFKTEAAPMYARARPARRKKTMDGAAARAARLRKEGG